ncbi:flagellar hook-length control protein FliK [Sporosarcina sp. CAU 1771]
MNIAVSLGATQTSPNRSLQGNSSGTSSFGTVFNSVRLGENPGMPVSSPDGTLEELASTIQSIVKASSIEEVQQILNVQVNGDTDSDISAIEDLESLFGGNYGGVIKSILTFLEESGAEVNSTEYMNDFWSMLNTIEDVAPRFFDTLLASLQGEGNVTADQAVEVLAYLKIAVLEAPKMDLLTSQEQQLFSLQRFLLGASEQLENKVNASSTKRLGSVAFLETHRTVNFSVHVDSEKRDANQSAKDSFVLNAITGTQLTAKPEISFTEMENRATSRNEALMKEMQQIFNRSNFGQTPGTNRLLIKLYPEHLGQIRIELLQVNGIMTARILVSTALGKEMLDSQLHQLRAAFLQQNLQVERIDISQTLQNASREERNQEFNQHFRREHEDSNEHQEQSQEEEMTFQEYMIELEA